METLRTKLDHLINSEEFYPIYGEHLSPTSWAVEGNKVHMSCIDRENKFQDVIFALDEADDFFIKIGITEAGESELQALRKTLMQDIEAIRNGKMKVGHAKAISSHVQTVINLTKLEIQYRKMINNKKPSDFVTPKEIKESNK